MFGLIKSFLFACTALSMSALTVSAPVASGLKARQFVSSGTGEATFYSPGLGSCGIFSSDSDLIVAVSSTLFDSFPGATPNPNTNPICGKQIQASFEGKSVVVTVVDRCPGCAPTDLDFSPAAFNQLADPNLGRIRNVEWSFI